jgi:hypothetical protein
MGARVMVDWRELRALRANPPGRAGTNAKRRDVFTAALEQAEQYLRAAANAGYPTKPVQLFYALSQSGRAICAAHSIEPWLISGHGASATPDRRIANTCVSLHQAGALPMVAEATKSELWEGPVTLGALWASLPDLHSFPLDPASVRCLPLERYPYVADEVTPIGLHAAFVNRAGLRINRQVKGAAELRRIVDETLAPYPRAAGASIGGGHTFSESEELVWLTWEREEYGQRIFTSIDLIGEPRGALLFLRPGLGTNDAIPSPLVTWWGILLALSTLARYEPVAWRKALDIDKASTADPLERALDEAERQLPGLVLEALLR